MNHNEFVQALKAGKVSGAYLFEGVEENIKSVTLAALRKAVLADGLAELNESVMENPSAGEIIAACETLPFASDKRLVVVRELNGTTGRSEAEERLVSYIPKVPDSCVLVIYVRGKADGRKKLYSAVKKKGGIVSFEPLGDAELNGWIVRVFQQNGKKCAPDVASLLSFTVGNDTALLRAEIEKLTALAGDRDTITENDVHAVATRSIECTVFEMVDAVVAGQRARALMLLRDMLTAGQERLGILAMQRKTGQSKACCGSRHSGNAAAAVPADAACENHAVRETEPAGAGEESWHCAVRGGAHDAAGAGLHRCAGAARRGNLP